jgi:hypothetical protein
MTADPLNDHHRWENDHLREGMNETIDDAHDPDEQLDETDADYIATEEEVFNAIDKAYKDDRYVHAKLLGFIQKLIFNIAGKHDINGKNAADFLAQTLDKIACRVRKWKKNRIPNIVTFIIYAAKSDIRHEAAQRSGSGIYSNVNNLLHDDLLPEKLQKEKDNGKKKKKHTKPVIIPLNSTDKEGKVLPDTIADIEKARSYKEDSFGIEDTNGDFEEMISKTEKQLEHDEVAYFVFQERIEGVKSNKVIAAKLGISVREVENALKRIKRVI